MIGHEDGSFKQVGRQCIRDFLGWNPDSLVPFLRLLGELVGFMEQDGESWGGRATPVNSPEEILLVSSRVVAHDGFYQSVSKKQAAEIAEDYGNAWSTKDRVLQLLEPPRDKYDREFHAKYNASDLNEKTAQINAETIIGIGELLKQDVKSDWAWSIESAWNAKYLKRHQLGVIASAVILGLKRIEAAKEQKEVARGPQSDYVGHVGEKWSGTVTVTDTKVINGDFYSSTLISMVDDSGNVLKWFYSGSGQEPEVDARLDIRGTIKKHEEYRGRKSTVLTRCKWEKK